MGDVLVASTTDTQDQVNQAAGAVQEPEEQELEQTKAKGDAQVDSQEPEKPAEVTPKADKYIKKLTARAKTAEERAAVLEKELEEARKAKPAEVKEPAAEEPQVDESHKSSEKFPSMEKWGEIAGNEKKSFEDYLDARDEWRDEQKTKESKKAAEVAREKRIEEEYEQACEDFRKVKPDFDEVVSESNVEISPEAASAIKRMGKDAGPRVVFYLAQNPDIAKELKKLTIGDMLLELGSIKTLVTMESSRHAEPPPSVRKGPDKLPVTSAPPPIKGLSGHSTKSAASLDDPDISYADWRKMRDEQAKARFRR